MGWPTIRVNHKGNVIVADGFSIAFFLTDSHSIVSPIIEKAMVKYVDLIGIDSLNFYLDEDGYTPPLNRELLEKLKFERFHSDEDEGGLRLLGSDNDISSFKFYYYGFEISATKYPNYRNVVSFVFPTGWINTNGINKACDFAKDLSGSLPFSFGYACPTILYEHPNHRAFASALRYPGMTLLNARSICSDIGDNAAGIYWLSFWGEKLTSKLGGYKTIRSSLSDSILVKDISRSKVLVQLGSKPEAGDTNKQIDLPLHCELHALLSPYLHIPTHPYFFDSQGDVDPESMKKWHYRFN
ncbi:MAG: DUF3396 domain-containing protein [Candidatus Electrothrix sp. AR4]|nr:DUF3396 domain-containing protein [Candidatus Electrothrix sp. AR4]